MFGDKGGITVRVTLKNNDGTEQKIMFGDSYKSWYTQATEYIYRTYGNKERGWKHDDVKGRVLEVEKSLSQWVGWGGLKWCDESLMQEELNREGCQDNELDNPNPRQYSTFKFNYYPYGYRKLIKLLKEY